MLHPVPIIAAIALSLGTVEGIAYWWMHPASAGHGEPVLVYRPQVGLDRRLARHSLGDDGAGRDSATGADRERNAEGGDQATEVRDQGEGATQSSSSDQQSTINNHQPSISPSPTLIRLPEIYAKSAPMLRCTSGQVLHAALDDTAGIHLAFFEWDGTDTGSVLEAFRHMPEACMGSIGMKLVSREKPIPYTVGSETLVFDHTVFREGGGASVLGPPIHAFRAVWVAGLTAADSRQGLGGNEFDRLRTIRLKSALHRFHPAHARVIQGAVRGIPDPALAWQAFEQTMLKDLDFAKR